MKFYASSETFSNVKTTMVPELKSDHEEADTRCSTQNKRRRMGIVYKAVAIKSPDTDVRLRNDSSNADYIEL